MLLKHTSLVKKKRYMVTTYASRGNVWANCLFISRSNRWGPFLFTEAINGMHPFVLLVEQRTRQKCEGKLRKKTKVRMTESELRKE